MTTKYNEIKSLSGLLQSVKTEGECNHLVEKTSIEVTQIVLSKPLDMHLHLRDAEMLGIVAPLSAKTFSGAVIMPNLLPAIETVESVLVYKGRIKEAI